MASTNNILELADCISNASAQIRSFIKERNIQLSFDPDAPEIPLTAENEPS